MARAIDALVTPSLPWDAFLQQFEQLWRQPGSPLWMDRERFVAEFIAPNMTWQRDWAQELPVHGALPATSPLPERVQKRLAWQAVAEFTYLSHRGRNLERMGKAALGRAPPGRAGGAPAHAPDTQIVRAARPGGGDCFQWLWGWLNAPAPARWRDAPRTHRPGTRWCHMGPGEHRRPVGVDAGASVSARRARCL